jgi:hypothetical protein
VVRNSSQPWPSNQVASAITVRVQGQRSQPVSLQASGGWQGSCNTGAKVEYEEDVCEFGKLWPGVYRVSAVGIPAQVQLYMDGVGFAQVVFETLPATLPQRPRQPGLMGAGAWPLSTPTPAVRQPPPDEHRDTDPCQPERLTYTPAPSSSWDSPPYPNARANAHASPWLGRPRRRTTPGGAGTIVVRVLGARNNPSSFAQGRGKCVDLPVAS